MALSESGDSMPRDHIYLCCGIDPSSYYNLRVVLRLGVHRTVHQPLIKFLPWSEAHINYTGNVSGYLSDLLWTVILLVYCNWVVNQEELSTTGRRFFHLFWSLKKLSEVFNEKPRLRVVKFLCYTWRMTKTISIESVFTIRGESRKSAPALAEGGCEIQARTSANQR